MIRLFVEPSLSAGNAVAVSPEQAHYLVNVMRRGVGDELLVFNGRDGEWRASVIEASKRRLVLRTDAATRPQALTPDLELIVALVKRGRLETIVEKAAELGARAVRLVATERTNADRANIERLQAIATEASEQTGRLDTPMVLGPVKLGALLDGWDASRRLVFCDEGGDARPMLEGLLNPPPSGEGDRPKEGGRGLPEAPERRKSLSTTSWSPSPDGEGSKSAILIGPEGGFSSDERARLRSLPFVMPVTLGPRILRADTAAIAALTLWQAAWGDWRG